MPKDVDFTYKWTYHKDSKGRISSIERATLGNFSGEVYDNTHIEIEYIEE